ncbi:MAG: hypothetical protein RSD63_10640 [Eubacterium sp.]
MAGWIQRIINKKTGVNRRNVNKASRRKNIRNTFRRKSSGGAGG